MFENTKNSKQQGDVGLGAAIAYYTQQGYTVCIPLTDSQDYDLIVDDGKKLNKVQVKSTASQTPYGVYSAGLRVCGGNQSWGGVVKKFNPKQVDLLFVLCDNGDSYSIPTSIVKCVNRINLGKKYQQYKTGGIPSV